MRHKQESAKSLSRREILKCGLYGGIVAGLAPGLWLSGCRKRTPENKLNVLCISVDTLRADHTSCYGYKRVTTPNIDQLAGQGHRFSNAYTTMPTTLPAHASLFTSLYPTQLSVRRNGRKVPREVTTLAGIRESSGYSTAAFVSSSVMNARYRLNKGFQTYDDTGKYSEQGATITLNKVKAWLKNYNNTQPFFLFVHLIDPHTFYRALEVFRERFGVIDESLPPERQFVENPDQFTSDLIMRTIAAYDAEIAYADWSVGKLLSGLKGLGMDEDTLIVLTSDHGESLDELMPRYSYAFAHGEFLYSHQLHIPLVIHAPHMVSVEQEKVHTTTVSIIDIMPTILNILGIEPPSSIRGHSLVPMLEGKAVSGGPVFSERSSHVGKLKSYLSGESYSIIEDKWHLIFSTNGGNELYNLIDDPGENHNLKHERKRAQLLASKLKSNFEDIKPLFGPPEIENDREAVEQLRSLGYIN
jgi:arylsulfatase A-like enzyme